MGFSPGLFAGISKRPRAKAFSLDLVSAGVLRQRQSKRKHRTLPRLTGNRNRPIVRLDDGPADRQSHPGSRDVGCSIASAIELVEDKRLLGRVDTDTAVGDAAERALSVYFSADVDRLSSRGVLSRVFEQIGKYLLNAEWVGGDPRHLGGDPFYDLMVH